MIKSRVELIDGMRPERVAHLGPVEGDPDDWGPDRPVVGDVGELEAGNGFPQAAIKGAGHVTSEVRATLIRSSA